MRKIFISYRREDSAAYAGRLRDDLVRRFGRNSVFMDIDTIQPGRDFKAAIRDALAVCDVAVILIGRRWATISDEAGVPRLNHAADFVRLEVETALARANLTVIPVLVQKAAIPDAGDLPNTLQPLTAREAHELSDERWRYDVDRLFPRSPWPKRLTVGAGVAVTGVIAALLMIPAETSIRGYSVLEEASAALRLGVDYTYIGDHGTAGIAIIASAVDAEGNRKADGKAAVPVLQRNGTVPLTIKALPPRLPFDTTRLELCLHVRNDNGEYETIKCSDFDYAKAWK